jgi:hypothetical protein
VILITKTVYIHEIKKIQWRTILARNVSHHCFNGNHFFSSVFAFLFVVLQALVATVLAAPSDVKERTLIADTFAGAAHHVAGAQEDFALGLIQGADQLAHPLGGLGGDYYGGGHLGSGHLGQEHLGHLGGGHLGHLGGEIWAIWEESIWAIWEEGIWAIWEESIWAIWEKGIWAIWEESIWAILEVLFWMVNM